MKIAILGTRGIPNKYGGFEQFAEYLSTGLVKKGHIVTVYNSSEHTNKSVNYNGVKIISKYCPESNLGAFAHFIYDFICSRDAIKKDFDIIYHAGYQSSAPAIWYYKRKKSNSIWITNMDGLEWKRDKWKWHIKLLTKYMEKLAVNNSDFIVSDNVGIKNYYKSKFYKDSKYIAYGAEIPKTVFADVLNEYSINKFEFFLIIARMEPENKIEMILNGYVSSNAHNIPFILVGNFKTNFGRFLTKKYKKFKNIRFVGGLYSKKKLDSLRKFALIYFHGHTVGGTNPSLLEAMSVGAYISANDNIFNRSVLKKNGVYFSSENDIATLINSTDNLNTEIRKNVIKLVEKHFSWQKIINDYEFFFKRLISLKS